MFSVDRQVARDGVFVFLLLVYVIAAHTWIFKTDAALVWVEVALKATIPVILLLGFKKFVPPSSARTLLWAYVLLLMSSLFVALISEAPLMVLFNTAKYFYILLFSLALSLILRPESFSLRYLRLFPVVGSVFALQTLVLFTMIQTHSPPPSKELILIGYKNLPFLSYGIFGYGWGSIAAGEVFQVYRAQSFFPEPTRMASFLELCLILGWGLYRTTRRGRWLLASILCGCSFVITFSMTGYIVMFLTVILAFLALNLPRWKLMAPPLVAFFSIVATSMVIVYLKAATGFYGKAEAVLNLAFGHAPSELTYRVTFLTDSLRLFVDHPLGIGVIGIEESRILQVFPGAGGLIAPLEWLVKGGLFGLTLQLSILGFVFFKIAVPQIRRGGMARYVSLGFTAQVLHHCVAGDWFDPIFFLVLWSVVMLGAFGEGSWGGGSISASKDRARPALEGRRPYHAT